ncbi:MAG: DUF58 domain-containing protein [Polyangiaceae bacterium]
MSAGDLLDPAFVRELEVLRRRLEVRARSGGPGEHLSRKRGGASEFQEHRPYGPGDDLRRIDWAAYARTDEPVMKVFRAEEDVVVRVLIDTSASLDFAGFGVEAPTKMDVARKIAAAIGYMALARSERAQLFGAAGPAIATGRGRAGLVGFLRSLGAVEARGSAAIAGAIDGVVRRSERPGMLAVVSDFLEAVPVWPALSLARSRGHDVALVHVVAPHELEPPLEGDLVLEDAETGARVDVSVDGESLGQYAATVQGLFGELRAHAKRLGATYVVARTDEGLEKVMRRFVARALD